MPVVIGKVSRRVREMISDAAERSWSTVWYEPATESHSIATCPAAKTATAASSATAKAAAPLCVSSDPKDGDYDQQNQKQFCECSPQ
jgi:hypothetical protein